MKDRRPDPKPHKRSLLWQEYLYWDELMQMRKKHLLRLSSIERGKSTMDAGTEQSIIENLSVFMEQAQADMIGFGQAVGPVWDWLTGIKGIGDHTAAKLLALFDDVAKFATISKFWRFSGQGLYEYWIDSDGTIEAPRDGYKIREAKKGEWIFDGTICEEGRLGAKEVEPGWPVREHVVPIPEPGWELRKHIDVRLKGWCSPFNVQLRSEVWIAGGNFVKSQTPGYIDIYYMEKKRQRAKHPEKVKTNGKWKYNDGHLHNRAMRKMRKTFLAHLWLTWRESEGLPVSKPYVQAVMGHTNIVEPRAE